MNLLQTMMTKEYKSDQQLFDENQSFYLAYKNKYLRTKLELKRRPQPEFEKRLDEFWVKIEDVFKQYVN